MKGLIIDDTLLECVITGTHEGLEMAEVSPLAVGASKFNTVNKEISVIVGLHGETRNGNMAINLSKRTAVHLAGKLMGEEIHELDEDAIDALCEIGNMVAGRFKELLINTPHEFRTISLPAIIFGANYTMYHTKNITSISVMFELNDISIVHMGDKFFNVSIALLSHV
ncbi:MAG: chemotaxis protein CheX [Deltaproteobacteria bacterium]|nr:chemotaxis protein CheX [Deltaproteobacteria bacterium]MBN2670195.1 chemotaxis protein CheX [Deltaproteobacteria bacterium]